MHREAFFTARDGLQLYEQSWLPTEAPQAIIALVHGMVEHSGRYEYVANYFCRERVGVFAFDLRGHGRSKGPRVYVASFRQYLEDVEQFVNQVRSQTSGLPLFLLAHSLGGLIGALYVITKQPELTGVILSGPLLKVGDHVSKTKRIAARILGNLCPRLRLSLPFNPDAISRDPNIVERFRVDPLVYRGGIPARTGNEVLRAIRQVNDRFHELRHPLLIVHGTTDHLADIRGSERLCETAGSKDKTLIQYDGLYHEVMNEPERDRVLGDLVKWVLLRVA